MMFFYQLHRYRVFIDSPLLLVSFMRVIEASSMMSDVTVVVVVIVVEVVVVVVVIFVLVVVVDLVDCVVIGTLSPPALTPPPSLSLTVNILLISLP